MPRIRQEHHIRRDAITLGETVDITTYDRVGKRGIDNVGLLSAVDEAVEFIYTEGGSVDDVVAIAFISGGSQMQLKLSGSGSKGQHLTAGADGLIVGSNVSEASPLYVTEFGVALADWTDGEAVECDVYKV